MKPFKIFFISLLVFDRENNIMESVKSLKSRDQLTRVEDATEWHQERSFQTCVEGTPTETAGHSTVFKNRKGLKSYKMCSPTERLTLNLKQKHTWKLPKYLEAK